MSNLNDHEYLCPIEREVLRGEYRTYFTHKRNNFFGTIQQLPEFWDCFLRLDEIWIREFEDMKPLRDAVQYVPIQLFVQSHAQFRVAFELGFSTCLGESWNVIRGAIDSAVQAHKIYREPRLALVWSAKNDGGKEMKEYRKHFETFKQKSLFPEEHGLRELYEYYTTFSEVGTHASISALAERYSHKVDENEVSILLTYLEADLKKIAGAINYLLSAAALIERACFGCFKDRLNLDVTLASMRSDFEKRRQLAAQRVVKRFGITPPVIWPQ